jgi:hypothetical protein
VGAAARRGAASSRARRDVALRTGSPSALRRGCARRGRDDECQPFERAHRL